MDITQTFQVEFVCDSCGEKIEPVMVDKANGSTVFRMPVVTCKNCFKNEIKSIIPSIDQSMEKLRDTKSAADLCEKDIVSFFQQLKSALDDVTNVSTDMSYLITSKMIKN